MTPGVLSALRAELPFDNFVDSVGNSVDKPCGIFAVVETDDIRPLVHRVVYICFRPKLSVVQPDLNLLVLLNAVTTNKFFYILR